MNINENIQNGNSINIYNDNESIVPEIDFDHIDEIFHNKVLKIPNSNKKPPISNPRLKIILNDEQIKVMDILTNNDISVLFGRAGSGKTLCATYYALKEFEVRAIDKIYITRPTISKENIGYLPGGIEEKMEPWMQPIYHNLYACKDKEKINSYIKKGDISIQPLSFMRGITYKNSVIIVDECQNVDIEQMIMIVTRLGKGSKLILCGDTSQIDLHKKLNSGLQFIIDSGKNIHGFATFELKTNHRHSIVDKFIDVFDKISNKNLEI